MFPLIPALILLLLHGPSNFERLAETGRLPAALAVFHYEVSGESSRSELGKEDASRRVLATLIAASGDRELSEAFASMFLASDSRPTAPSISFRPGAGFSALTAITDQPPAALNAGFLRNARSRDGPSAA